MDQERPIEKLLRETARARSQEAGPPPELHPADRRILQDEVKRCYPPAPARTQWWHIFAADRFARVSWATALVFFLGIALWIAVPRRQPISEIALNTTALREEAAERKVPHFPASAPAKDQKSPDQRATGLAGAGASRPAGSAHGDVLYSYNDATDFTRDGEQLSLGEDVGASGSAKGSGTTDRLGFDSTPSMRLAARAGAQGRPAEEAAPPLASVATASESENFERLRSKSSEQDVVFGRTIKSKSAAPATPPRGSESGGAPMNWDSSNSSYDFSVAKNLSRKTEWYASSSQTATTEPQVVTSPAATPGSYGIYQTPPASASSTSPTRAQKLDSNFRNAQATPVAVLANFRLEQVGDSVTVHDEDGSTYKGYVLNETKPLQDSAAISKESLRESQQQILSGSAKVERMFKNQPSGASFQVSGTNLTLNRFVNFSGQLTTNRLQPQIGVAANNSPNQANTNADQRLVLGEVIVDGQSRFKLEAFELK